MMQPNPIQRFLGLASGVDSPFELLGVSPDHCDDAMVRAALRRRLDRLRRHPESLSHEADEVRLALHAAAAQLLDPAVREQLAAYAREPHSQATLASGHAAFRELAAHVLARAGGWNQESRQWLGLLAHAHGVSDRELQAELRAVVQHARSSGAARAIPNGRAKQESVYDSIHAPRRRPRRISIGVPFWAILSTATLAVVVGAVLMREVAPRGGAPAVEDATAPEDRETSAPPFEAAAPAPVSSPALVVQQLSSPEIILRWLDIAHDELNSDPGQAAWRFERATEALSQRWHDFSPAVMTQAQRRVISFIHRIETESLSGDRALSALTVGMGAIDPARERLGAADVRAGAWSAATLLSLAVDPDVESTTRRRASDALRAMGVDPSLGQPSFSNSAEAAMSTVARRMVAWQERSPAGETNDAWSAWIDAVDSVTGSSEDAIRRADRIALQAAEFLLISEAHVSTSAPARDALAKLLSSVRWTAFSDGAPPPSWGALLAWFDEPSISVPDLAVVTEWVVARSGAPAVSPEMTLSRGSIVESRAALRDRYARVWDADVAADAKGFAAVWARTIRETVPSMSGGSMPDTIAQTALLARFNAAAALRWRGDVNDAGSIVVDPTSPVTGAMRSGDQPMGVVRGASAERDGSWAARYLDTRLRDIEERTNLLAELGRTPWPLGPIDADVLASVALQSPANELRTRAQEVVRRRAAEPGMVSAVLDAITKAPRNASTSALVTDITGRRAPSPADESWEALVRLALADRLIEMLAPQDEWTIIDRLAIVIGDAYAVRADVNRELIDAGFGAERDSPARINRNVPAHVASEALYRAWRERAEALSPNSRAPVPLGEIERRRLARQRLAVGPLQRFASDQACIVELMAFVISAERPSRAGVVADVMTQFSEARRGASSIIQQTHAAERAMLALWAVRFGLSPADVLVESGATPAARAPAPRDAETGAIDSAELDQAWLSQSPVRDLRERLEAMTPDDPLAAFNLAEELAYESDSPQGRDLARRLFALASEWDAAHVSPRRIGASVHLALADLSTRSDERRWHLAVALSLDPTLARVVTLPEQERAAPDVRLALAEGLELYRLGEYGESLRRLERPAVRALLEHYEAMLTGGAQRILAELATGPNCRECRNDRIVPDPRAPGESRLCPTCAGDPGPDLSDEMLIQQVRLERAVLEDEPSSWSAALMATRGEGMREVGGLQQ